MPTSLYRSVYRLGHTDDSASLHRSYGRTDGRTDVDRWLRTRDHLTFRNARAHIRNFPSTRPAPEPKPRDLDETRKRADQEAGA